MRSSVEEFRKLVQRGLTPEQEAMKREFIKSLTKLEDIVCGAMDKKPNLFGKKPHLNVVSVKQTREVIKMVDEIHRKFLGKG